MKNFQILGGHTADKTIDQLSPVGGDSGNGGRNFNTAYNNFI